jgi:hypothetical protein
VFYDRVRFLSHSWTGCNGPVNRLLAYVLVHEITHIIEGICRHSTEGIMKANWERADYFAMGKNRFVLARDDVELINRGLVRWAPS